MYDALASGMDHIINELKSCLVLLASCADRSIVASKEIDTRVVFSVMS